MTLLMGRSGIEIKKKLASYYSPDEVCRILCGWGIRKSTDKILEPSFGSCGFLEASRDRLNLLKCKTPSTKLFGCDVDKKAFNYLSTKIGPTDLTGRFILSDFLDLSPQDFSVNKFEVVIGNPPYIPRHKMTYTQLGHYSRIIELDGFKLDRKASLWAYFVLHSLTFLKTGGRVAWILPGSMFDAEYARSLQQQLIEGFARVLAISLGERIFTKDGTEENTVVLLCDGWGKGPSVSGLEITYASVLSELNDVVLRWEERKWKGDKLEGRSRHAFLPKEARFYYDLISKESRTKRLGDLADILIGIVTGANYFFVLNQEKASKHGLADRELKPILAKLKIAKGLSLGVSDFEEAKANNMNCLLVDTFGLDSKSGPLRKYLDSFPVKLRENNCTFAKRDSWHNPDDGKIPDAFFPYMQHHGPRLILNDMHINSTNTIHRIYFNDSTSSKERKLAAISMLSTFSQLSAEIEGRSYGSGVLKIEPGEARNLLLVLDKDIQTGTVNKLYSKIDKLLRKGQLDAARAEADRLVLAPFACKQGNKIVETLSSALRLFRARRLVKVDDEQQN